MGCHTNTQCGVIPWQQCRCSNVGPTWVTSRIRVNVSPTYIVVWVITQSVFYKLLPKSSQYTPRVLCDYKLCFTSCQSQLTAVLCAISDHHGGTTEEGNGSYLLPLSHRDYIRSRFNGTQLKYNISQRNTTPKETFNVLHHWPFVMGNHRSPVVPLSKGQYCNERFQVMT